MNYDEITNFLKTIDVNKNKLKIVLKKRFPEINSKIMNQVSFLDSSASLDEILYCIKNNIKSVVLCDVCKINKVKFHSFGVGYRNNCSVKCSMKNKKLLEKRKENSIKRYGVEHPMQSKNVIEKLKSTNQEKYGVDWIFQSKPFKEHTQSLVKERYGVDHIGSSIKIREKIKQTNLKKYGVDHPLQNKTIYDKTIINQNINYYRRILKTNEFITPLFKEKEYSSDKVLKWQCKKCEEIIEGTIDFLLLSRSNWPIRCKNCLPILQGTSNLEQEIIFFIKSIYKREIKENIKSIISPLELDIYIPDKKIAIEFDGLYWHSEIQNNDKNYHLNKTQLCEDQDIHLIHIFENEWIYQQEIVKSRLKNILGISDRKIYARNCEVKEIDSKISEKFLEENHLQGNVGSSIRLGLFFKDELVSLMTFSKTRFSKKYEYEMLRFCNLLNTSVIGSASKLLKYFEKKYKPKSLVSYADRRWSYSQNNVYKNLNFKLSHIAPPNYWYFKNSDTSILESRVKYQKHKLPKLLEKFDPNMTEVENMRINGYERIFDCGNLVYVKEY